MKMQGKNRMKTRDVAFGFRMGAGFPGDVNRSHPVSIESCLIDPTTPPTAYGQAVVVNVAGGSAGVRPIAAADQSNTVQAGYGVTVRPYPFQQPSGTNFGAAALGAGAVPTSGAIDVMRIGYIMVNLATGAAGAAKGLPVYVWAAASSGAHVQGGFESTYSAGNTVPFQNATFNGPADANGNVEISLM